MSILQGIIFPKTQSRSQQNPAGNNSLPEVRHCWPAGKINSFVTAFKLAVPATKKLQNITNFPANQTSSQLFAHNTTTRLNLTLAAEQLTHSSQFPLDDTSLGRSLKGSCFFFFLTLPFPMPLKCLLRFNENVSSQACREMSKPSTVIIINGQIINFVIISRPFFAFLRRPSAAASY